MSDYVLRLATRGSPLACHQADFVGAQLCAAGAIASYELVIVETVGDASPDLPIAQIARQGVFTSEVELAVIDGRADVAVHSAKDLPSSNLSAELSLAAAPVRADVRDVLVGVELSGLHAGSTVATGSVRRRIQLLALVPGVNFVELRGNIATRLAKVPRDGSAVFAYAALDRLGLLEHLAEVLSVESMLPQVGQGVIALRCRTDDRRCREALARIDDKQVHRALLAERAYLAELGGGCEAPVGAYAKIDGASDEILLEAMYGSVDGTTMLRMTARGQDPVQVGTDLARAVGEILAGGSGHGPPVTVYLLIVDGRTPRSVTLRAATLLANADVVIGDASTLGPLDQTIGTTTEQIALVHPASFATYVREVCGAIDRHRRNEDAIIIHLLPAPAGSPREQELEIGAILAAGATYEVIPGLSERAGNDRTERVDLPRRGPLVGMNVVITRARHQISRLGDLLLAVGARPIIIPVIDVELNAQVRASLELATASANPDWVVFTSQNAVSSVLEVTGGRELLGRSRVACVGSATASRCSEAGVAVAFVPTASNAQALVREFPPPVATAPLVLFFAGQIAGRAIERGLGEKGYLVERVTAYETHPTTVGPYVRHRAHGADSVIFTSASTVHGTVETLGREHLPKRIISIGPTTSAAVRTHGLVVTAEAAEQRLASVVDALIASFA